MCTVLVYGSCVVSIAIQLYSTASATVRLFVVRIVVIIIPYFLFFLEKNNAVCDGVRDGDGYLSGAYRCPIPSALANVQ